MASLREIGSAFVRLFVRKDELSSGLKQAEAEVRSSAEKMQQSTAGIWSGLRDVRKTLNDTIGVVFSLIARFTAVTAVIGLIVSGVQSLYDWMNKAKNAAKELGEHIDDIESRVYSITDKPSPYDAILVEASNAYQEARKAFEEQAYGGRAPFEVVKNLERSGVVLERLIKLNNEYRKSLNQTYDNPPSPSDSYDPDKDPILKSAEEFRKRHEDAIRHVVEMYHKMTADATAEWGRQIQKELADAADAFNRLQSTQRNQSASADIKIMTGLLKQLVNK